MVIHLNYIIIIIIIYLNQKAIIALLAKSRLSLVDNAFFEFEQTLTIIRVLQFSYWREFWSNLVSLHSLKGGAILPCNFLFDIIENILPSVVRFLFINLLSVSKSNCFSPSSLLLPSCVLLWEFILFYDFLWEAFNLLLLYYKLYNFYVLFNNGFIGILFKFAWLFCLLPKVFWLVFDILILLRLDKIYLFTDLD